MTTPKDLNVAFSTALTLTSWHEASFRHIAWGRVLHTALRNRFLFLVLQAADQHYNITYITYMCCIAINFFCMNISKNLFIREAKKVFKKHLIF